MRRWVCGGFDLSARRISSALSASALRLFVGVRGLRVVVLQWRKPLDVRSSGAVGAYAAFFMPQESLDCCW